MSDRFSLPPFLPRLLGPARCAAAGLALLVAVPLAGAGRFRPSAEAGAQGPPVRVLLLEAPQITVGAAGRQGLALRDAGGRLLLRVDPGNRLRVRRMGAALSLEPLSPGNAAAPGELTDGQGPIPPILSPLQELSLEPIDRRDLLVLRQRRYRGTLLVRPEGEALQAINRLPLESYLGGVVGSEMPDSWPQAALKAQAVASRTYALQQLRPQAPFDLRATVESQVYKGMETESPSVLQAVASTHAQVLMHGNQLINAVFHSSSGGRTENSGELWSRQLPYLVSVPDFDTSSPVNRWEKVFAPASLREAFGEIGGATAIQPLQSSSSGRLRQVRVMGPGGELLLSGSQLRQRLGLRSTLVEFRFEPAGRLDQEAAEGPFSLPLPPPQLPDSAAVAITASTADDQNTGGGLRLVVRGRGFGHGVGMSQWGAFALAQQGKSHEAILRHYYRGAVLRSY